MESSFAAGLADRGEASIPKPLELPAVVCEQQLETHKKAANKVNRTLRPCPA